MDGNGETTHFLPRFGIIQLGVSKNSGTPKSSILIGFSIINHPFWDTTIFGIIQLKQPFESGCFGFQADVFLLFGPEFLWPNTAVSDSYCDSKKRKLHRLHLCWSPMKYWLFNRDPYFMVYFIIPISLCRISSPTNPLNNVSDGCERAQRLCHMQFTWEFTIRNCFLFIIDQWIFHIFFGYLFLTV